MGQSWAALLLVSFTSMPSLNCIGDHLGQVFEARHSLPALLGAHA
jgi:hypothetical protein